MIASPGMICTFPAEGGGVGGTCNECSRFRGERRTRGQARTEKVLDRRFRQQRVRRPEQLFERLPERDIDIGHGHELAEIDQ